MKFTEKDESQFGNLGIKRSIVIEQLERFQNGFPDMNLSSNVQAGCGLKKLNKNDLLHYVQLYNDISPKKQVVKFVPASGAASRMFKVLYNYLDGSISLSYADIQLFFSNFHDFAFSNDLIKTIKEDKSIDKMLETGDRTIIKQLLFKNGLNYGELPKALLTFHSYSDGYNAKACDEHLIEGALHCADENNHVQLHFTVSEEHLKLIDDYLKISIKKFEETFQKKYDISYSVQDKATNTLAVNVDNTPFRLDNGDLLFRPGGHGALLKNLNDINADIVFIKNIDNVAAEWLLDDTILYKKALGGVLLEIQNKVFAYCRTLNEATQLNDTLEKEIIDFLYYVLGYRIPTNFTQKQTNEKIQNLFEKLNRPLRVCGVIEAKNTGGGPFWVQHPDGSESLQLVETAQVNMASADQVSILNSSNYANITDLVCGLKDYNGDTFDLMHYRDPDTGFIAEKSIGSKTIKAMELPGLWNGAMSDWNTAFVEVPISTFNPVKTVLDLLKKEHQGKL